MIERGEGSNLGMERERERDGAEMGKQPVLCLEPHNSLQRKRKQREIGGVWFNTTVPSDHFFLAVLFI